MAGLDERLASPYLAAMANRLFLTLLALLTGLVAQVGPAQARVAARHADVGAVVCIGQGQRQGQPESRAAPPLRCVEARRDEARPPLFPRGRWQAPTVLPGIDRAHE